MPLSPSDPNRRHLERVLVTILGESVADNDARIADCSRDGQDFEFTLREIAEHVEIVHFVADIKERMLGVIAGCGRADDHSGGVLAVTGNVVRGGGVTAECSKILDGVSELTLSL